MFLQRAQSAFFFGAWSHTVHERVMPMRLYHFPLSLNARRAVMTADHLGIDVELVVVNLAKGE
jgi:hypothetical protein